MTNINHLLLFRACLDHPYSDSVCFLCADPLNKTNSTEEHVIPKWIQQRYDLWNQRLVLLNKTLLPYRQLTVPCCIKCNGRFSELEKRVQQAVDAGPTAVRELPQFDLFQWLAKIFLGITYKELFLLVDRTNPKKGSIGDPDRLESFALLHFWLQVSMKHAESEFTPGSIFVVPTTCYSERKSNFDLLDNWDLGAFAIRLDGVGIVTQFLDYGVHKRAVDDIAKEFEKHEHDYFQFREFSAKVFYKASLLNCESTIDFVIGPSGELNAKLTREEPATGDSLFGKWEEKVFARILAFYTGVPLEELFEPPDKVNTWCPWDGAQATDEEPRNALPPS